MLFRAGITMMTTLVGILAVTGTGNAGPAGYRMFDPAPAWPLCGRITQDPPPGWTPAKGCPRSRWGNPAHSDLPANTTYGPRVLPSQGDRYDFHRGLDLATPIGTPVFAMTRGIVRIAGHDSGYADPLVMLRHFRPDRWGDCTPDGCYHSLYLHLSDWVVSEGDEVQKGQLIGFSGESEAAFAHLHFEIRDAIPEDAYSAWQRDAIHPLRVMPYPIAASATQVAITQVDAGNPFNPVVTVLVREPSGVRALDINRVEIEVYDRSTGLAIFQPGSLPDANGYHVHPPWLDIELRNREYTHKSSPAFPWSSFATCPFAAQHGSSYSSSVHVDRRDPDDKRVAVFNGIRVAPNRFNNPATDYELTVTFTELIGTARDTDLCIVATVRGANSAFHGSATWNCAE